MLMRASMLQSTRGHAESSAVSVALPGWGLDGLAQAEPLVFAPNSAAVFSLALFQKPRSAVANRGA